ncbi:toxin-antitoxin system YwqK family antitoxin [Flavobacterium rhizosphaerae]|uniref:MORN repeat variant n=1 Tax=Flavobacterium rhizosphaerae TaxID=3163298 RepID=A0ABW8YWI1_9FLAO
MKYYLLVFSIVYMFSFSDTSLKKRISDENYRYEFYTTNKKVSPRSDRNYYWFKGGRIHQSEEGVAGELLHDEFLKFYHSNQLAESGLFKNGLREGVWKTWFEDGTLQSVADWHKGQKDGKSQEFDKNGDLLETGRYRNNKKHGVWIIAKDTLQYKKGILLLKAADTIAPKTEKPKFWKRIFKKKQDKPDDSKKVKKSKEQKTVKKADRNMPEVKEYEVEPKQKTHKQGFFKRLFSGKKTTDD